MACTMKGPSALQLEHATSLCVPGRRHSYHTKKRYEAADSVGGSDESVILKGLFHEIMKQPKNWWFNIEYLTWT